VVKKQAKHHILLIALVFVKMFFAEGKFATSTSNCRGLTAMVTLRVTYPHGESSTSFPHPSQRYSRLLPTTCSYAHAC